MLGLRHRHCLPALPLRRRATSRGGSSRCLCSWRWNRSGRRVGGLSPTLPPPTWCSGAAVQEGVAQAPCQLLTACLSVLPHRRRTARASRAPTTPPSWDAWCRAWAWRVSSRARCSTRSRAPRCAPCCGAHSRGGWASSWCTPGGSTGRHNTCSCLLATLAAPQRLAAAGRSCAEHGGGAPAVPTGSCARAILPPAAAPHGAAQGKGTHAWAGLRDMCCVCLLPHCAPLRSPALLRWTAASCAPSWLPAWTQPRMRCGGATPRPTRRSASTCPKWLRSLRPPCPGAAAVCLPASVMLLCPALPPAAERPAVGRRSAGCRASQGPPTLQRSASLRSAACSLEPFARARRCRWVATRGCTRCRRLVSPAGLSEPAAATSAAAGPARNLQPSRPRQRAAGGGGGSAVPYDGPRPGAPAGAWGGAAVTCDPALVIRRQRACGGARCASPLLPPLLP